MDYGIRRIFYDLTTGDKIHEIGRQGNFILPSIDQDIATFTTLSERNRETFDVIELPYGFYNADFSTCSGYRVNPATKELEFSYPDPNEPEVEQPHRAPLSVEVEELKKENNILKAQNQALTETTDFHEELIVELAMVVYS